MPAHTPRPERRRLLRTASVVLAAAAIPFPSLVFARTRLPEMTEGPFYPVRRPLDADADLTRVRGQPRAALGEVLELAGVVRDEQGRVVDGAEVEIWQCDVHGSYHHPRGQAEQVDAGFQGFGMSTTDARGAFRFRTIRPAPYPGRTPHIHVKLRHVNFGEISSQWFVAGEARNEHDFLYRRLSADQREAVLMRLQRSVAGGAQWQTTRDVLVPA